MPKVYCPECDAVISIETPRKGATIKCPECDVELEVISIKPFEVSFPLDYGEDGDDNDEEWSDEE